MADQATSARERTPEEIRREIEATRERLTANFDRLGHRLENTAADLRQKADVLQPVRQRVRRDPLPALGLAFAAGALVGLLRGGKKKSTQDVVPVRVVEEPRRRRKRREEEEAAPEPESREVVHTSRHPSFLRELAHIFGHQISNALIAAVASVITAKLSKGEVEEAVEHAEARRAERRPPYGPGPQPW